MEVEHICANCTHKSMGHANAEFIPPNTHPHGLQRNTLRREDCKCGNNGDWQIYGPNVPLSDGVTGTYNMDLIHVDSDLSAWDPFVGPSVRDGLLEKCVDCLRAHRSPAENLWWDRNSARCRSDSYSVPLREPARTFG
jgi:hypothetical protein